MINLEGLLIYGAGDRFQRGELLEVASGMLPLRAVVKELEAYFHS